MCNFKALFRFKKVHLETSNDYRVKSLTSTDIRVNSHISTMLKISILLHLILENGMWNSIMQP